MCEHYREAPAVQQHGRDGDSAASQTAAEGACELGHAGPAVFLPKSPVAAPLCRRSVPRGSRVRAVPGIAPETGPLAARMSLTATCFTEQ